MKRRMIRVTVVMAVLLTGVMGVSGLMGTMSAPAEAGDDLEFTFFLPRPLVDCTGSADPFADCPAGATASNGETIAMNGTGTLSIDAEDGEPDDVDGGGGFVHTAVGDPVSGSGSGTWEAKKLLMFETYGPGVGTPAAWRTGRALILVHLEYDDGLEADAILEIGCRLPGNGGIPGTIEGMRILIGGGLNFNAAADPRATLFVDLTEPDDD